MNAAADISILENLPAGLDLEAMREHAGDAAQLLKALANENRLMILCSLAEGELSVGDINARVPLSQSALSQHLALLRRDGLVFTRRASQTIHYSLAQGPVMQVMEVLHKVFCGSTDDEPQASIQGETR